MNTRTPSHCKNSFHETVATEIYFETKLSTRFSCISIKSTGTDKAITKEANKFNEINFNKSSSVSSLYETSSPGGIENQRQIFWHENESIYKNQIVSKLLNSEQLYCATKLPHVI